MEVERSIKLLLVEDGNIEGLIFGRHRATIHQVNSKAIRYAKALPKLSLRKKFGRLFRMGATDTFSWPTIFLALTSRTGEATPLELTC